MSQAKPAPEQAAAQRSNRRQLLLIAAIAAVSISGSYLLYFSTIDSGVWGTTNLGEFVEPAINVNDLQLQKIDGQPHVHGQTWWVWLVQDGACDAACLDTLVKIRNMHVLLNKDADRLRRAWVRTSGAEQQALRAELPLLHQLKLPAAGAVPEGIYIVDPLGNLVLRYPVDEMGKPVLTDLKRLLKVSQIG